MATGVIALIGSLILGSGWVAAYFAIRSRSKAELAAAEARRDSEEAAAQLADRDERLRLYGVQLATYRRQVRELADDAARCGDPDAVRAALNRLLSDQDGDEVRAGDGELSRGSGVAGDAYDGDLR